ncbi:MAG TPA: hypothetical protein VET23_01005 [Chitinophagaceae bacterium]|nr:hypothetical protein [Chitinophagaceae bacterium]
MTRFFSIIILLIFSLAAHPQMAYLFVKKGIRKKKIYVEEERIMLRLKNGAVYNGLITLLKDDTIFINGHPVPAESVQAVILSIKTKKSFHIGAKELLLISGGAALTIAGLSLSKQATFKQALTAGLVIGFGPLLIQYIQTKVSLRRRQYVMGKKFHLQILDFHVPAKRGF